jgi:hypothetical protein
MVSFTIQLWEESFRSNEEILLVTDIDEKHQEISTEHSIVWPMLGFENNYNWNNKYKILEVWNI